MSARIEPPADVRLPVELEKQLTQYRNSVWISKITEAIAIAVCAILLAFLGIFVLDRCLDTPPVLRVIALTLVGLGWTIIPFCLYRWVWRRRKMPQVARLISRQMPDAGDRLLGVLELVGDPAQQQRSGQLCRAAIQQVATEATDWNLTQTALPSRRKRLPIWAVALLTIAVGVGLAVPAASRSSWARLLRPWSNIPRYCFAAIADVPQSMIVAHGEPFTLELTLASGSPWKPASGKVTLGNQPPLTASLDEGKYRFDVLAQINETTVSVRIGDARHQIQLLPTLRPDLTDVMAHFTLPAYLGQPDELQQDVRGGALSLVTGTRTRLRATANRELASAHMSGIDQEPAALGIAGSSISSSEILVDDSREVELLWTDKLGLEGKQPFKVTIAQADDEPPILSCQGLARQQVVLVSEQLRFEIQARDDFGVREVGMEWNGFTSDGSSSEFHGERALAAGGASRDVIHAAGTFTADKLGIEPQPVSLRIYAEDYLPERGRIYSPAYVLYVLTPDQHAVWLTDQLSKWHRRALEVRDRELQLYETNKQLRALPTDRLELNETRERIEHQAAAERGNGRRLSTLTSVGKQLVQQATRNPEFGVGHLEKWAQMLQLLQEISANRMPSVADLLKAAADAPQLAASTESPPTVGVDRSPRSKAGDGQPEEEQAKNQGIPQIVDAESSQQPLDPLANDSEPPKSPAGSPSLALPVTTLMGKARPGDACPVGDTMPVGDKLDDALVEQRDLLAEFERIANELNNILANLEGSSLVKRLKSASRQQYSTAGKIGELVDATFGFSVVVSDDDRRSLVTLSEQEDASSLTVSYIMDDMQAYFQRRPFARFRTVIDQMQEADIVSNLRNLSEEIPQDQGLSMAQCEYWSDSLDRWAEDLVDPAGGGT